MKTLKGSPTILLILLTLIISLQGCTSYYSSSGSRMSQIEPDDPASVVRFKQTIGTSWYEVKYIDVSVGWAKKERSIKIQNGTPVYQFRQSEEILLQILGTANLIKKNEIKTFSSIPPYPLLSYSYVEHSGKNERSLLINRIEPGRYEFIASHNDRQKKDVMGSKYYTIEDELGLEMWVQTLPEVQDYDTFTHLGLDLPRIGMLTATIQDVRNEYINGENRKVFEIGISSKDQSLAHLIFSDKGELRFAKESDRLQYHVHMQKPVLPSIEPVDLYVYNMVPITKKIGKAEQIQSLHLTLNGPNVELFETATGQRVIKDVDDMRSLVIFAEGSPGAPKTKTLHKNIRHYSESTPRIRSDHPDIEKMAREAVGDSIVTEERISMLVQFVDDYISDGYIFETDLADLLKEKRGDCTEHALLFATLARSLGIPCRVVYGLVYMGDWCRGFGLHAWNEVVVDGHWRAVDASRGASTIDPVYIRFPDDSSKFTLLVESMHQMKIDVEEVKLIN